jgi:two-component system sensor histidine kinase KdpD
MLGYVIAALCVLVVILLGRIVAGVNPTTIALAFLLGVLAVSTFWGLRQSVFMAVIATLAFNYFFLPPFGTLTIADPQNWVALFAFLITAVTASELSERRTRLATPMSAVAVERLTDSVNNYSPATMPPNFTTRFRATSSVIRCASAAISLTNRADIYRSGPNIDGLEARSQLCYMRAGLALITRINEHSSAQSWYASGRKHGNLRRAAIAGDLDAIGGLIAISVERAGAIDKLSRAEAARESEQMRSLLLDSVTHEFCTPLTAIKASVTSLLGSASLSVPEREELLTVINEESDRLNRLVGEAAAMAQLDAGKVELHLEPNSIGKSRKMHCRS